MKTCQNIITCFVLNQTPKMTQKLRLTIEQSSVYIQKPNQAHKDRISNHQKAQRSRLALHYPKQRGLYQPTRYNNHRRDHYANSNRLVGERLKLTSRRGRRSRTRRVQELLPPNIGKLLLQVTSPEDRIVVQKNPNYCHFDLLGANLRT